MAGLVPAIHVCFLIQDVDARDFCAKTRFALLPGHDERIKLFASHLRHPPPDRCRARRPLAHAGGA
ncbi:hypothetical protein WN72_03700 [Bradyrhizobium arachidis]|uniref:Uncharacterized protein n=1 Tax=Bradyrhizobium arachidis TaxID=858423 RepID=A0AAE7NGE0_9BRAD|nr:hypothetical protein WN72_03700 [Bradyrhizobium arachidis]